MSVIYFDLETTGINNANGHRGVQILAIGAVSEYGATFHRYLYPECEIDPRATNVHGIQLTDGRLYKNGVLKQNAVDQITGLELFMDWLQDQDANCLVTF